MHRKTHQPTTPRRPRRPSVRCGGAGRRGSSLLLVIWTIMMMSLAVVGLVRYLDRGLQDDLEAGKRFRARLLAESALVLAQHPEVGPNDPLMAQRVSPAARYEVRRTTEGRRINLNQVSSSWQMRRVLMRLFELWGIDANQARSLVDAIVDWTDADDEPRRQGAERDVYAALGRPDFPLNRPFRDVEELLLVRGLEVLETANPLWREWFTIHGDGTIDLNEAPELLIEALFDVTPEMARELVDERLGPDGLPWTEDDRRLDSLDEVRRILAIDSERFEFVQPLLTLDHPVKRIEARAVVGDFTQRLILITGGGVSIVEER